MKISRVITEIEYDNFMGWSFETNIPYYLNQTKTPPRDFYINNLPYIYIYI